MLNCPYNEIWMAPTFEHNFIILKYIYFNLKPCKNTSSIFTPMNLKLKCHSAFDSQKCSSSKCSRWKITCNVFLYTVLFIDHFSHVFKSVQLFNICFSSCQKLFKSLKEDYQKRSPYIAYLVRCRQGLLSTLAHLERYIVAWLYSLLL